MQEIRDTDYFYFYAAFFEYPYPVSLPIGQSMRLIFAIISGALIVEHVMIGPVETFASIAHLSLWAHVTTLLTMIYQYKSVVYETQKAKDTSVF